MHKVIRNSLLLIIGITFLVSCTNSHLKRDSFIYSLTLEELSLLREGDILLRQGHGMVSRMIVESLREVMPLSHVGLLTVDPSDGQFKVIHSVSQSISKYDGIQIQDLNTFLRGTKPNTLVVVRYRHMKPCGAGPGEISRRAYQYLEMRVPFDYDFDFSCSDRFFCTELVSRVIWDVYNDELLSPDYLNTLTELDRLRFGMFFNPDRFDIIINHQL